MAVAVGESVLRALVEGVRRDETEADVVIVSAPPHWPGDADLRWDDGSVRVAACVSPLAVREALAFHDADRDGLLVVLTDVSEEEVGQEVLARIWRHRFQRPSRWEAVRSLFRVSALDPALADSKWLVDLLVEVAPARGYPPPTGQALDLDTAWRTVLRHALRIPVEDPTLVHLLEWGDGEAARFALEGPPSAYLTEISKGLGDRIHPVARHLLPLVAGDRGRDILPLGLVCDVLWARGLAGDQAVDTARVRFEAPLGTREVTSGMARAWADAAVSVFRDRAARHDLDATRRWGARAEALLFDLGPAELAVHSSVLTVGFGQRLIHVGKILLAALESEEQAYSAMDAAIERLEAHTAGATEAERDRIRRARMAARLVRWLSLDHPRPGRGSAEAGRGIGLIELAKAFVTDGAWVDAAREAISHGDSVSTLAEAYDRLSSLADDRRRERDRAFGRAFAEWNEMPPVGPAPVVPIERVLDEVVGPLAEARPVLFLVLDGWSYPESIQLSADLERRGWWSQAPEDVGLPIVAAALPTVTTVSRATLLSGALAEGGQDVERRAFEAHRALRAAGGRGPRLFHKKDLKVEHGRIVAAELQAAILDPETPVVGVVVNAVDDHLEKGGQLRLADGLRGIRPLGPLLDCAAEAGRVVVIASDHGHVLESGSVVRPAAGGERWRPSDTPALDDEVEIAGPRVLKGGGRIIVPAVDTVRYIPMEKRGYHGGATPQEALCPLMVLTVSGTALAGWERLLPAEPVWWRPGATPVPAPKSPSPEPGTRIDPGGQVVLTLDKAADVAEPREPSWLDAVLASPVLDAQRQLAGRQSLDDDNVRAFLEVLWRAEGVASPAALASALDLTRSRLRTKLVALGRMVNVDGYAVLTIESDGTARLNFDLLRTQFEVAD